MYIVRKRSYLTRALASRIDTNHPTRNDGNFRVTSSASQNAPQQFSLSHLPFSGFEPCLIELKLGRVAGREAGRDAVAHEGRELVLPQPLDLSGGCAEEPAAAHPTAVA